MTRSSLYMLAAVMRCCAFPVTQIGVSSKVRAFSGTSHFQCTYVLVPLHSVTFADCNHGESIISIGREGAFPVGDAGLLNHRGRLLEFAIACGAEGRLEIVVSMTTGLRKLLRRCR